MQVKYRYIPVIIMGLIPLIVGITLIGDYSVFGIGFGLFLIISGVIGFLYYSRKAEYKIQRQPIGPMQPMQPTQQRSLLQSSNPYQVNVASSIHPNIPSGKERLNCGNLNPNRNNFCENCGAALQGASIGQAAFQPQPLQQGITQQPTKICLACKHVNPMNIIRCENCGKRFIKVKSSKIDGEIVGLIIGIIFIFIVLMVILPYVFISVLGYDLLFAIGVAFLISVGIVLLILFLWKIDA